MKIYEHIIFVFLLLIASSLSCEIYANHNVNMTGTHPLCDTITRISTSRKENNRLKINSLSKTPPPPSISLQQEILSKTLNARIQYRARAYLNRQEKPRKNLSRQRRFLRSSRICCTMLSHSLTILSRYLSPIGFRFSITTNSRGGDGVRLITNIACVF